MIKMFERLLSDEFGSILSAELVLVGTVGLVAVSAGWRAMSRSVDAELAELAAAIRHLDQSYSVDPIEANGGWHAGSAYTQPAIEQSVAQLDKQYAADRERVEQRLNRLEERLESAVEEIEQEPSRERRLDAPPRRF